MGEVPEVLDWVKARSQCSPEAMFALLTETIDSDTKAAEGLLQDRLDCKRVSTRKVVVSRVDGNFPVGSVIFEQTNSGLTVTTTFPQRHVAFEAVVLMREDGRCRYEINAVPLELWQVSQKALEPLFFGI